MNRPITMIKRGNELEGTRTWNAIFIIGMSNNTKAEYGKL